MSNISSIQSWLDPLKKPAEVINLLAPDIFLLTGGGALIFAAIIFISLQRRSGSGITNRKWANRWAGWFGAATAIWGIQYGVRYGIALAVGNKWVDAATTAQLNYVESVIVQGCSSFNNLLFLSAARVLMREKKAIQDWAILAALVSLVGMFDSLAPAVYQQYPALKFVRFPDVAFSAYCLYVLGRAIAVNIRLHYSRRAALAIWVVAAFYTLLHVVYALIMFSPAESRALVEPVIFAVALPLKFALLFAAYFLLLRNLTTFESLHETLHQVTHGRHEFLSQIGIVRPIGDKIGADSVDLSIRLPGRRDECIASFHWRRGEEHLTPWKATTVDEEVDILPLSKADELVRDCLLGKFKRDKGSSRPRIIAMPVFFHGAVIGCLKVEREDGLFSSATVQQVREIAALLSPALQSYRELAALDRLSIHLADRKVKRLDAPRGEGADTAPRRRGARTLRPSEFVQYIADTTADTLTPAVCRLTVRFGFKGVKPAFGRDEDLQDLKEEFQRQVGAENFDHQDKAFNKGFSFRNVSYVIKGVYLRKKVGGANSVTPENEGGAAAPPADGYPAGDFVFAFVVPNVKQDDDYQYPALGTRLLHRKVVATIIVDAYLDFTRAYFGRLLNKFSQRLNREIIQPSKWSKYVQRHARQAGLLWAAAARPGRPEIMMSSPMPGVEALLTELRKEGDPKKLGQRPCREVKARLGIIGDPVLEATNHVIGVPLRDSEYCLWFGVGRRGFGDELRFMSPWRVFLESFTTIADAALERYARATKFQRLQMDAARAKELAAVAATTGVVLHRLTNMARNQSTASSLLVDGLKMGRLSADDAYVGVINSINYEATRQLSLLQDLVHHADNQRPSNLYEAAEQASHLYSTALLQSDIRLKNDIDRELQVDVPLYVSVLALSNLVSNAKEAINYNAREAANDAGRSKRRPGLITISAEANGDYTLCHVTDNGAGIPDELLGKIFEVEGTTKGQSGGWGLFLVNHSLKEHGSQIYVERTGPEGTTFTIRFPKPKQE